MKFSSSNVSSAPTSTAATNLTASMKRKHSWKLETCWCERAIDEFALATTFPFREFKAEGDTKTISRLVHVNCVSSVAIYNTKITVVNPMFATFSYVMDLFTWSKSIGSSKTSERKMTQSQWTVSVSFRITNFCSVVFPHYVLSFTYRAKQNASFGLINNNNRVHLHQANQNHKVSSFKWCKRFRWWK